MFRIFKENYLCWSLFNKVAGLFKKILQHRCFPVNIAKFLRSPILKNICQWLLLTFFNPRLWNFDDVYWKFTYTLSYLFGNSTALYKFQGQKHIFCCYDQYRTKLFYGERVEKFVKFGFHDESMKNIF